MTGTKWRMLGCRMVDGKWTFFQEQADADMIALRIIHDGQIERYGKAVVGDFPDLLKKPVIIAMIAERDGRIVDGAYGEATIEWCHVGCDSRAAASLRRIAFGLMNFFKKRGFRILRTFVPRVVEGPVGKELTRTGFKKQDEEYSTFLLDLR